MVLRCPKNTNKNAIKAAMGIRPFKEMVSSEVRKQAALQLQLSPSWLDMRGRQSLANYKSIKSHLANVGRGPTPAEMEVENLMDHNNIHPKDWRLTETIIDDD